MEPSTPVAGVMRPEFWFPHPVFQIWTPWKLTPEDYANRTLHSYTLLARLKPGTKPSTAARS